MKDKDPEKVSDILKRLLAQPKFKQKNKVQKFRKIWIETVGEELSQYTRVLSFQNGILRIEVENSSILQELSTFRKEEILEALQKESSDIIDLKFLLGAF